MLPRPILIVIFGLIASGKTTLAKAISRNQGWPVVHSDMVRKNLVGIPATRRVEVPFGQGIYAPDISGRTYQEMFRQARDHLESGSSVILEGSFMRAMDRQQARDLAAYCQAEVFFILCSCSAEETLRRLAKRSTDSQAISNGRQEILMAQQKVFEPITDLQEVPMLILDTERPLDAILEEIMSFLNPDCLEME
jgi:predicted kinase